MLALAVCIMVGTLFFYVFPGENKPASQSFYMSVVTLSTVGFGTLTPSTEVGMAFASFWMIIGVACLGSLLATLCAYMATRKRFAMNRKMRADTDAGAILRTEYA